MSATQSVEAPAPRRGRPPKVTREAILDAVDAKKAADWTMASIAAELGVSEPAIYYHFPSKQALLVALGARVMGQLNIPAAREDWESWLREYAEAALDLCRAHPFLLNVDMASVAVLQSSSVRVIEQLLEYLCSQGFESEDALVALAMVMSLVQQISGAGEADVETQRELAGLAKEIGASRTADAYSDISWDTRRVFNRMLDVIIAGIRSELAPTRGGSR